MKYCVKCGQRLEDEAIICPNCAALQTEGLPPQPPHGSFDFDPLGGGPVPRRKPKGLMACFIWSFALMLLGSLILGIVSFMFTMMADSVEDYDKAHLYVCRARLACVIETAVLAVLIGVYVIIRVTNPALLSGLSGLTGASSH